MRVPVLIPSRSFAAALFPALAISLFPAVAAAAGPSVEVQAVVDLARNAPPEVAADALIRVAALNEYPPTRRVELLEQALQLAPFAAQPYKRHTALSRSVGPSGFLNRAYEQNLDALSLELRAVEALIPLAPRKARDHFLGIPPLRLPPLSCDDFLVYDVDRFYDVLGQIAAHTFSAKEVRDEEPVKFLAGYLSTISAAAQVAPAARLLEGSAAKDAEFQSLATALAGALVHLSSDDRSFLYAAGAAGPEIRKLAEISQRRQISPMILLEAYRQFLANHLSGARCSDDTQTVWSASADGVVSYFNQSLAIAPLQPIDLSAIKPADAGSAAKGLAFCEDAECRAMREQYRALIFTDKGQAGQPEDRQQNEWQAKARDFLTAMAAWTQSAGAAPVEHFREKIALFNELLIVAPQGPTREFVLQSLVEFLIETQLPPENRMEWLLPVSQLAGRVGLDRRSWSESAGDLRRANNSAIALAIALETVAPRPLNAVMPVL